MRVEYRFDGEAANITPGYASGGVIRRMFSNPIEISLVEKAGPLQRKGLVVMKPGQTSFSIKLSTS